MPPANGELALDDPSPLDTDIYGLITSNVDNYEAQTRTPFRSLSPPNDLGYLGDEEGFGVQCSGLDSVASQTPVPAVIEIPASISGTWGSTTTNVEVQLPVSTLTEPRSLYDGFEPPAPETTEVKAVAALLDVLKSEEAIEEEDFLEFDLQDFSIYLGSQGYFPNELKPLQHLTKTDRVYFDGTLSRGDTRFYLRRVPFGELPVGNYGADNHSVGDQIWIRSCLHEYLNKEIYYKLGSPSVEYARFHEPFLWIADLAKHVIDYCDHLRAAGHRATIFDFKFRFSAWLLRKHRRSRDFQKWYHAYGSEDFRRAVAANVAYLWREACGVDQKGANYHCFWREVGTLDYYQPNLVARKSLDDDGESTLSSTKKAGKTHGGLPKTAVTPYIHDLFSHMSFGSVLEKVPPSPETQKCQEELLIGTHLQSVLRGPEKSVKRHNPHWDSMVASIQCGDVISTPPDDAQGTNTKWKLETSVHHEDQHVWYGLVQKIHLMARGRRSFDVIWLYHPRDTPCAKMKYPWKNELFLSDNCTCHSNMAKVKADDIISTHSVHWFGDPSTSSQFFVRQTYMIEEQRWATLREEHMKCETRDVSPEKDPQFEVGDAVLVHTDPTSLELENFVIEALPNEGEKKLVRLRKLLRRKLVDPAALRSPPNELVYSEKLVKMHPSRISRRCLVRVFRPDETIPAPYDRNGTGDAFFITHQELVSGDGKTTYAPVDLGSLGILRQAFDPSHTPRTDRLRGLDLFCGGGNFGRGLEEGGAIEMRWANDIWKDAIHTYMANTEPDTCTPFLGSVDDLLRLALLNNKKVPRPGEVQFISGGSPCPGFSLLTIDKTTDQQRKNQSLVASFASFVDLYRPRYGLLENVIQMVQTSHNRNECVFSQLVSAIVGLGYQTQILFMDAWSFGAPQSRSRVFLLFTAPGLRVPKMPVPTHSHPPGIPLRRLGLMSNGQGFSQRERVPTPFKFLSAREAVDDLPDIQDGKADYCVKFPDHRLPAGFTPTLRKQIQHIPTQPWEMNFSKAYYGGIMAEHTRRMIFPKEGKSRVTKGSKGWGRVHPDELFPTITTRCCPSDTRVGQANHWYQSRSITTMEARRAQGFPDHEVLVGPISSVYHVVGNSVARQVALALGLAIREAWFGTLLDDDEFLPQKVTADALNAAAANATTIVTSINTEPSPAAVSDVSVLESSSDELSLLNPLAGGFPLCHTPLTTPGASDGSRPTPRRAGQKRPSEVFVEMRAKRHRFTSIDSTTDDPLA